jgi:hypothetical protein
VLVLGVALDAAAEALFLLSHRPGQAARPAASLSAEAVSGAIESGALYLGKRQRADGSLRGFLLPPGASVEWITAHVAFVLEGVPALTPFCRRAAKYLWKVGYARGGWGFKRRVGFDSDSAAQALMVIHRFGSPIENRWVDQLVSLQAPCGGYPTFRPAKAGTQPLDAWQKPHPDVTVIMIEMMQRLGRFRERRERAMSWVQGELDRGVLRGYWWKGDAYGLWAQARVGPLTAAASRLARTRLESAQGVPDLPMYLTAALADGEGGEAVQRAVRRLLRAQHADGSWSCEPCLRVTDPTHSRAGPEAPGPVFGDRRRVFSTTHAVAALQAVAGLSLADAH